MPRSLMLAALMTFALGGITAGASPASAHGWHRHHHHHYHRHHRGLVHSYAPRHRWTSVSLFGWGYGCGLRRFVTKYGALAYREVCD